MGRVASMLALLVGIVAAISASGESYVVTYDPYYGIDWSSVLRCRSQHHDHVQTTGQVLAYDLAGYDAITFMTYSGVYAPSSRAEWEALGSPSPDPGKPVGYVEYRRWPPQVHGAPDPSALASIRFYIPGAEELGLLPDGTWSMHFHSAFLETYIEGAGCDSCGVGGVPVARNNSTPTNPSGLSDDRRYANDQQLVDRILQHGGHATLNHPIGPSHPYAQLEGFGSMEVFNNYMALLDERDGGSRGATMLANWDELLETRSSRIWGVSVNDWFGPYRVPMPASEQLPALTERNLDRGKLEVLVTAYDLPSYRDAFEAGAFFAVVDDHETKGAHPRVTGIAVGASSIALTTATGDESVTWIGNGSVVGSDRALDLLALPPGLAYVRAEIEDAEGRIVYTQPFSLAPFVVGPGERPRFEEVRIGASGASTSVSTSAPLTGGADDLYLAAVSSKRDVGVTAVSGLGLPWAPVRSQCGARGQTGISVWSARGRASGDGIVRATLSPAPSNAVISVSRYSLAGALGNVASVNTAGPSGACVGGSDASGYAFDLPTTPPGSLVYLAAALRNRQHLPDAAFSERVAHYFGSGGEVAGLATADAAPESFPVFGVQGSFSSSVDYGVVAVEILPVPEPDSVALLSSGIALLLALRRWRSR